VNKTYIAVKPSPKSEGTEIAKALEASPTSNWAIASAILIAAMPHLWQWLGGYTKARNNLTETLLQKLSDSYQHASVSNEAFRKMIEDIAEKPTEIAEKNTVLLRDIQAELIDTKKHVIALERKLDFIASNITKQAQNK
jgi:Mg2+ and Co2+ transporter CorA